MKTLKARRVEKKDKAVKQQGKYAKTSEKVEMQRLNLNSISDPLSLDFVKRGCYVDSEFICIDCNAAEVWRATQQKWWYEVAKGHLYSRAVRCAKCRRKKHERDRKSRRNVI